MGSIEKDIEVLKSISLIQHVRQRDLAEIVGLSLGMINAIVKRLVKKGWLSMKKLNNRTIHYAVSPAGMKILTQKGYQYLRRTVKNVVYYKESIAGFIRGVREKGFRGICLVGKSDLDFIVKHCCHNEGIGFYLSPERTADGNLFYLFSENTRPEENADAEKNTGYLSSILLRVSV
ncbi:MAG: winged helix-turn-helix transcriptional regulator [Spirochaetales bacterium]|nr:winged helix-turn-helix transcriptional regulator [Spirochaetales bacterium]